MRSKFRNSIIAAALFGLLLPASSAWAASQQAPNGTRAIEQDWRVELYTVPEDGRLTCPLFISGFSIPGVEALFQCTWNHRDIPVLEEGGIQLQAYKYENLMDNIQVNTPPWRTKLANANEVVTWTQRLHIASASYVFTVKNINGTTWGAIPGPYTVSRSFLFWAPPLEGYDWQAIADHSGIIMGSNRFKKLSMRETRFYDYWGNLLLRSTSEKILFDQPQTYSYFTVKQLNE